MSGFVAAQGAIGNGVPQPRVGKAQKLTVEQCKAHASQAASSVGDAKDLKTARLDRYCPKILKKAGT